MDLANCLSLIAAMILVAGYIPYSIDLFSGQTEPKLSSWILWSYLTILNAISYRLSSADGIKSRVAAVEACLVTLTMCSVLFKQRRPRFTPLEKRLMVVGFILGSLLLLPNQGVVINLVLQLVIAISCWPTFENTWQDPTHEPRLSWGMWSVTYIINLIVICLCYHGHWYDLLYPINYIILHLVILWLACRRPTRVTG